MVDIESDCSKHKTHTLPLSHTVLHYSPASKLAFQPTVLEGHADNKSWEPEKEGQAELVHLLNQAKLEFSLLLLVNV